ncbi:unnamed protein product [Adineta ricciae]|uniref:Uncharacterized protein n=2 Tax=Adineta ricciae TaxID=249248 RepID=A0A816DI51_ADIRI|nr:unnamed protein product [Adineta ricciae]
MANLILLQCDTSDQIEHTIDLNKQYRIILSCQRKHTHEIKHLFTSRYVWAVYILGQYNTENVKVRTVNGNERDLMWYLMNHETDYLNEQEMKLRDQGDMFAANVLSNEKMSLSCTLLFYDPDEKHSELSVEQSVQIFRDLNKLYRSILPNGQIYYVLCLCCNDLSAMIEQVKGLDTVVAIWSCKEHCGSESNPTFNTKVRDDLYFYPNGYRRYNWLYDAHKILFEAYRRSKNKCEYEKEKEILKEIKRQTSLESQSSVQSTDRSDAENEDGIAFGYEAVD